MDQNSQIKFKKSTAIYPNRILDKKEVESKFSLDEFGSPNKIFKTMNGLILSEGFERIVYGDHGPYIEFTIENIVWDSWKCFRKNIGYYNIYFPIDGTKIQLYFQRKDVKNLTNPPQGIRSFYGNREEGYADYIVGKCYISPFEINLIINDHETSSLNDIIS